MEQAEKEVERLISIVINNTDFNSKIFSVGGFVRDELLGMNSKDLDIVVEEDGGSRRFSHLLHNLFKEATTTPYLLGESYPIWHMTFRSNVHFEGEDFQTAGAEIDIADTQRESFPDVNSRQRCTTYGSIEEDIFRRDFTINMILRDLETLEIIDLSRSGVRDLENGIIRGHPQRDWTSVFSDDPLRMLRAIRFAVKYDFQIHPDLKRAIDESIQRINIISSERIREEMVKIMEFGKLKEAILHSVELWFQIFPELESLSKTEQSPIHHGEGDAFTHTLMVLEISNSGVIPQLSALFHDIGKTETFKNEDGKITFKKHESVGADVAESILRRLKFDLQTIKRVKKIIEFHMRPLHLDCASKKSIRKFIRESGEEISYILDLSESDGLGKLPPKNEIPILREKIQEVLSSPIPIKKAPILNGNEIMNVLHLKPSPIIGEVSSFLLDLEDDFASENKELTKEEAIRLVIQHFQQSS